MALLSFYEQLTFAVQDNFPCKVELLKKKLNAQVTWLVTPSAAQNSEGSILILQLVAALIIQSDGLKSQPIGLN